MTSTESRAPARRRNSPNTSASSSRRSSPCGRRPNAGSACDWWRWSLSARCASLSNGGPSATAPAARAPFAPRLRGDEGGDRDGAVTERRRLLPPRFRLDLVCVFVSKSLAAWRSRSLLRRIARGAVDHASPSPPGARRFRRPSVSRFCSPAPTGIRPRYRPCPRRGRRTRESWRSRRSSGRRPRDSGFGRAGGRERRASASSPWRSGRWRIRSSSAHRRRSGRSRRRHRACCPSARRATTALPPAGRVRSAGRRRIFPRDREDRARFEDADRFAAGNGRPSPGSSIRIDRDEAAAELVAVADVDQPGVILGALMAGRKQFFEQDRHLLPVRRRERIELQRMAAYRQRLLVRRARKRAC